MNFPGLKAIVLFVIASIACVVVGLGLRAWYAPEWMLPDPTQNPPAMRPWAVEADCYSQLARVQRILAGQGLLQNHFTVENWPEGLTPSTTAPFDYAILLLYFLLWPFTKHPLDWAGALVSPALWLVLAGFWMLIRSREFTLAGRALLIAGSAVMPALIWATAFGHSRHQSLIFVLMAMALTAEYERWRLELTPMRTWNIFAGIAWGLACWTSLFEPVVVVGALILFNLIARRRENVVFLAAFGVVLLVMSLLEGGHIFGNLAQIYELRHSAYAHNWLGTIGELAPLSFTVLLSRLTWVLLFAPVLAWFVWPRAGGNKTDALVILLTVLLVALTAAETRWSYYSSLAILFLVVRYCQMAPTHWTRLTVLAVFLLGAGYTNSEQIEGIAKLPPQQPSAELAQIARAIDQPGGIMAPWWLSPGLLYFSGQPIVSGSSHAGMSGIVDSARFFTATSWTDALPILDRRKVRWVVIWDDPLYVYPVLNKSLGILGQPQLSENDTDAAEKSVAQMLIEDHFLPTSFQLRAVVRDFKLYEYTPGG